MGHLTDYLVRRANITAHYRRVRRSTTVEGNHRRRRHIQHTEWTTKLVTNYNGWSALDYDTEDWMSRHMRHNECTTKMVSDYNGWRDLDYDTRVVEEQGFDCGTKGWRNSLIRHTECTARLVTNCYG